MSPYYYNIVIKTLFVERARGPEARNLAVGPAISAGCGPGWPALIWLSNLHSVFFLSNFFSFFSIKLLISRFVRQNDTKIVRGSHSYTYIPAHGFIHSHATFLAYTHPLPCLIALRS